MTEAARRALERDLAEVERDLKEHDWRIRESWARLDAMPRHDFSENEMYDEIGVPK